MSKIPGIGELLEGVLERDPLDGAYQIRCLENGRQRIVRLQDVFAEYAGSDVRFTIAFAGALAAAAESLSGEGVSAPVTFDGLGNGS